MSYETQFMTARKEYVKKVESLKPSGVFLDGVVAEEKPKTLVKALDTNAGKPYATMAKAHVDFDTGYKVYLKKIETQIGKEKVDTGKLKTPLTAFKNVMEQIANEYLADCAKMQESEKEMRGQSQNAAVAINTGATAAAAKANQANLTRALDHFKGRRQVHLDAVTQFETRVVNGGKTIKTKNTLARDAVAKALENAKLGKFSLARQIADLAITAAKEAKELNTSLQQAYETEITKTFQKDRNLGWPFYSTNSEYGLPDELEGDFKKGQVAAKTIFDNSVRKGTGILNAFKEFDILVSQAEKSANEADIAAKIQDIRPHLREDIKTTDLELGQVISALTEEITNATNGSGPVASAEAAIDQATTKRPQKDWALLKIQSIQEKVSSCDGHVKKMTALANGITTKIPAEFKKEPEFQNALVSFAKKALEGKRVFNTFKQRAETTVSNLQPFSK
jgi:hypothetical protein